MAKNQIFKTNNPDFTIEVNADGWEEMYRLLHDGKRTTWTLYSRPLMLDGMVAVSPYYTEFDEWVMVTPEEACKHLCAVEDTTTN